MKRVRLPFRRMMEAAWLYVLLTAGCAPGSDPGAESVALAGELVAFEALDEVSAIRDLVRTESGRVWILNTREPFLVLQGSEGELVTAFGRSGDGPDELGFAAAIIEGTDTSVTVLDRRRRMLRTFRVDGREATSLAMDELTTNVPADLDEALYGSPFAAVGVGGSLISADYPVFRASGTAHLWNRRLVRIRLNSGAMEEVVDFRPSRDRFSERLSGASILVPVPLWAACADGSVVHYLPFTDSLTWLSGSPGGAPVPRSVRPLRENEARVALLGRLARRPGTSGLTASEREAMLPMVVEQLGDEISTVAPAYVEMLCDLEGRVWLQHFAVDQDWMGRGNAVDVVGRHGVVATDVPLPVGFRPLRFDGELILGVMRDDLDAEYVGRYRPILPRGSQ
jgi:hypothetical protein